MLRRFAPLLAAPALLTAEEGHSHHGHDHDHDHAQHLHESVSEAGWFRLHPHVNAAFAIGGSTAEKNFNLIQGSHAPVDDGFNLQGIEIGGAAEFGEVLALHAYHNVFWDRFDGWDSEWEEAYATIHLPGDVSIRGGQFFAAFGHENTLHLHQRQFVEPPISMVRLLGEEGLIVQGAELAWHLPGTRKKWQLRLGYGQAPDHSHGATRELRREAYLEGIEHAGEPDHGHEEGEEEHEGEEHGHHHGHGLAGNGGAYDAENAYLDDGFFTGRLETKPGIAGIETAGFSFAGGENGFGRTTWIAGADVRGETELADRPLWWQGEVFYRAVEARDEAGIKGDYDETGIYAACGYEFMEDWIAAGRLEWASGNRMSGNERRWRASANVGRVVELARQLDLHTRLQYSYDRLGGYEDEHSVWLQFVLNFGAGEDGHVH